MPLLRSEAEVFSYWFEELDSSPWRTKANSKKLMVCSRIDLHTSMSVIVRAQIVVWLKLRNSKDKWNSLASKFFTTSSHSNISHFGKEHVHFPWLEEDPWEPLEQETSLVHYHLKIAIKCRKSLAVFKMLKTITSIDLHVGVLMFWLPQHRQ